jgi:hypothetical protein
MVFYFSRSIWCKIEVITPNIMRGDYSRGDHLRGHPVTVKENPIHYLSVLLQTTLKKRATYMAALWLKHDGSISVAPELLK